MAGCSVEEATVTGEQEEPQVDEVAPQVHQEIDFEAYTDTLDAAGVTFTMVPVQGGTFEMGREGDGAGEHEGPPRQVKVDSFWMSEHEVRWNEFLVFVREAIEGEDPEEHIASVARDEYGITADALAMPSPPYEDVSFGMGHDGFPAISITNYAAIMYAKWLTARTGEFYRLPTEAEWEFACRGGLEGEYHLDGQEDALEDYEWHAGNSGESYNQVATKQPNPLGLYDMKGNIAEWTIDEYLEDYHEQLEGDVADNPWFKPDVLYPRAVRGGSWKDEPDMLRCTQRRGSTPRWKREDPQFPKSRWWHTSADFVGFRLVRPAETPAREEMEEYWLDPIEDY